MLQSMIAHNHGIHIMTQETALAAALKNAVQGMSKKKQTDMIAEHIYHKYEVFSRFKPLAIGIENDLIAAMPQFDPQLIGRVLSNHCRRPRYIKAIAKGGKRFNLNNRFQGEVSPEEQQHAAQNPLVQEALARQTEKRAAQKKEQNDNTNDAEQHNNTEESPVPSSNE